MLILQNYGYILHIMKLKKRNGRLITTFLTQTQDLNVYSHYWLLKFLCLNGRRKGALSAKVLA